MSDLDVLKEIPGYKAILKSVLKSQIHLLMEQLSEHTGEESIILTASVHDGSLSHLGSSTGKGFLEGRDEIKSQFLGYCLKTYHKKKTHEPQKPYQRTHPSPRSPAQLPTPLAKRPRPHPMSLTMATPIETYPQSSISPAEISDSNIGFRSGISSAVDTSVVPVKLEQLENQTDITQQETMTEFRDSATSGDKSLPESVHLSHTQTSGAEDTSDNVNDSIDTENAEDNDLSNTIKVEQVEDELEITGVEMAAGNFDHWGQGQPGYGEMDSSFDQSADQASYTENPSKYPCRVCDKKFKTAPSRRQHEVRHGPKTEYCIECGKQFFRKSELLRHKQCHSIETKYVCDICGNSFNQRDALQKHIHSFHDGITFTCNICHKVYASKSSLNKHALSHMENEECDLCHKLFKRSYIQEHKKLCSNPVRQKIHRCNLCDKSFFEQRYLKEHMNYTHGSQRYSCPMCGAPFQHRKSLLEHKRKCLKTD